MKVHQRLIGQPIFDYLWLIHCRQLLYEMQSVSLIGFYVYLFEKCKLKIEKIY